MRICNEQCEHAKKYNDGWAVCWDELISGSKVQLGKYCIVDLINTEQTKEPPKLKIHTGRAKAVRDCGYEGGQT